MKFDEILRRWNNGLSRGAQVRLAKAIGVSEGVVSRWVKGELLPGEEVRPKLAKELGIDPEDLNQVLTKNFKYSLSNAIAPTLRELAPPYSPISRQEVPIVGAVSADKFDFSFDYDTGETLDLIVPLPNGKKAAALRVVGDCMKGTAEDGDLVIVLESSAEEVPNKGLAVIRLNGECTLKRIFRHSDRIELKPDNPKFKPIIISAGEELHVVGVVRWILKKP